MTAIPVSYRWSTLFILQRLKIAADSAVVELARSCIIEMFLKLPFLLLPITFGPYLAVLGGSTLPPVCGGVDCEWETH